MLEILLIRHGQTDWNAQRRIMGDQPVGLNETGRAQVQGLAGFLKDLSVHQLYVSPLLRTQQTAAILNVNWNLPVQLEPGLREIEYGEWVGKTFHQIREEVGHFEYYRHPEKPICNGAESLEGVKNRGVAVIERLRQEYPQGRLALVSHADWIKCVLMHYLKIPLPQIYQFRIDNASLSLLVFEEGRERVLAINHGSEMGRLFIPRETF